MDSMNDVPDLASEVVVLLGKELKVARQRIKALESQLRQESHIRYPSEDLSSRLVEYQERAEAAEHAMEVLQKNVDDIHAENGKLRAEIDDLRDRKHWIKQEKKQREGILDRAVSALTDDRADKSVEELEDTYDKYRVKYKAQKEAKNEWRASYRILKEENAKLEAIKLDLDARNSVLDQMVKAFEATNANNVSRNVEPATRADFEAHILQLPRYEGHPGINKIQPVCFKGMDLKGLLAHDRRLSKCSTNFLYLPDRLSWCQPDSNHALALGPLWTFNVSDRGQWKKGATFKLVTYTRSFSLFYSSEHHIFYAGEYRAHKMTSINPEGVAMWQGPRATFDAILESTFFIPVGANGAPGYLKRAIAGLYTHDVLKVEVVGLQCVGFDWEVYNILRNNFHAAQRNTECIFPEAGQHPRKRRRT